MKKRLTIYVILCCLPLFTARYSVKISSYTVSDATYLWHYEFTEGNLLWWVKYYNIRFPEVFMAQTKVESGNYTSELFRKNNNLVGMRKPIIRRTSSIGERNGYAVYRHYSECVKDYLFWQIFYDRRLSKVKTNRDYIQVLKELRYAQSGSYSRLLIKQLKEK